MKPPQASKAKTSGLRAAQAAAAMESAWNLEGYPQARQKAFFIATQYVAIYRKIYEFML